MTAIKKLNVLCRNPDDYLRETKHDIHKIPRNFNPDLHPLQVAREYTLALGATKLERVFAKPFVAALVHGESVSAIDKHPDRLDCIFSGTYEGQLNLWDTRTRKQLWKVQAHNGHIWSVNSDAKGETFFTVGHDKAIKRWSYAVVNEASDETLVHHGPGAGNHLDEPMDTWLCNTVVTKLSHHRYDNQFLTCGERVLLWDSAKKTPIRNFDWNALGSAVANCSATAIKFSMVEPSMFASCDYDNHLILYDIRGREVKKLKMKHRLNDLCWNPMQGFILSTACEDYNAYTFDVRMFDKVERILYSYYGHTNAVTSIDYSPTGRELVTGSYDKSIRIFPIDECKSRDIYHGKRMHKVTTVMWSADDKFIYSGSGDHNLRIWKSRASEKLGFMNTREEIALNYANELRNKYRHMPEIKRIAQHRHIPRTIKNAAKEHRQIRESRARKEANRRRHSKPDVIVGETAQEKPIFGLQDEAAPDEERAEEEMRRLKQFAKKVTDKKKQEKRKKILERKLALRERHRNLFRKSK